MKLLLTSAGLTNKVIISELQRLCVQPLGELRLAFIPTAANIEKGDKRGLLLDMQNCQKAGFGEIDIVDIMALPKDLWLKRLKKANVILVGGGNTFYLMDCIRKTGFVRELRGMLKERVYVGISAGTIIVCPEISIAGWDPEWDQNVVNITDTSGLSYCNILISPHYVPDDATLLSAKSVELNQEIIAITDDQAVVIDRAKLTVVGGSEVVKFPIN